MFFRKSTAVSTETQQRLLEAAGEVFAEQGFQKTTVREICRQARANVAAVNYHFGDKEGLYAAVIDYAHGHALEKYPLLQAEDADLPAEQRLGAFIRHVLFSLFDEGAPAWRSKLMAREMIEPTAALDAVVERMIRPMAQRLESIVRAILGAAATDQQVRLCQLSIIGQCLHHRHAQPVIQRLFLQQRYGPAEVKILADHITRFSWYALKGLAQAE
ncbi:MAG: CerR family C-terminal domain-containing protein [Desulfobaccales bacterium]